MMICPKCQSENREDAKFCNECGRRLDGVVDTEKAVPTFEGERKYVTVLFSDLSGYTAMSERLDPEEVKEIMSRIFGEVAQVVTKYEGFIEKFIGDAVMAIYGVPKAHEDDPLRAIRAAREIHGLIEALSPKLEQRIGRPLTMHTGINTGLVVTGAVDLEKGTHGVAGDTVNIASRLMNYAKAGEILVGLDTYRQAEGHFTFETLKPTKVKGKAEPLQVYKVLASTERPSKIHRLHGLRSELIGRKSEMTQLGEAVQRLRRGDSTIVSLCGDAGTGKSRLVEEFKTTLDLEEIQWREGYAYAYAQNIPYFPLLDMMNRTWELEEGDDSENVKEKVESGIEYLVGRKEDVIPYIGSLYGLSYPEIEEVSPDFWKTRLHGAILEILSALAQRAPTIICLEDIHWADPSFLELLHFILSKFGQPAVFLCVYRPYFKLFTRYQLSALGQSHQEIRLKDLSSSEAQDMTESLLKTKSIPHNLRQFIEEKVEGNPFYVEEVINSLIESETLVRDDGGWRMTRSVRELGISPTIHGVISGRLDRLEKETKLILQEASVIGRAFLHQILKRITQLKDPIEQYLSALERLDLIRTRSLQPDLEYIFKHALTQEVVYEGLLKKERQAIHERIGLVMEEVFQDRLSEFYESLAFHFKQGLSVLKAVDYLVKSGDKSLKRYSVEESHRYYNEAYDLLANKPEKSDEEASLLIDLMLKWAYVFYYRGDFRGLEDLLETHKDLAESLDDKVTLGMFYVWMGHALWGRAKCRDAHQYLLSALKLGEEVEGQEVIAHACTWLTYTCAELGLLEEGLSFGNRARETAKLFPLDQDLYFNAIGGLGHLYWHRGETKKVFETGKDLLDYGHKRSNIRSLVWGHWILGFGHFLNGDFQWAIDECEQAIQISQDPFFSQFPRVLLGALYVYNAQFREAEKPLQEVVDYSRELGNQIIGTPADIYLGAVLMAQGRMGQGLRMIEEAQRCYLDNDRKGLYALSEYILGRIYLRITEGATPMALGTIAKNIGFLAKNVPFAGKKAETHFEKAIEVAGEIEDKGTLGISYFHLGFLHKTKGRTEQARECFSKAVRIFRMCEAKGYLKQAQEALTSLG
jgi:class 3 adenylate cyclase/tetratricopeptide (TPR) repeat protein